jgi:hypothetical protein
MTRKPYSWILLMVVLTLVLAGAATAAAQTGGVKVVTGPTPVINGDASKPEDITLMNDRLAVTFSVKTASPWGVARGGIVDGCPIVNGKPTLDRITLVDFLPNAWSNWPTTYQKVTVVKDTPEEGVIQTVRDWEKVELVTTFSLKKGEDVIAMVTTMTNKGDQPYPDTISGYVLWTNGGYLFSTPGLAEKKGSAEGALADWAVAYDQDWTVGLHGPYMTEYAYFARDLNTKWTVKPGESRTFEGWVQIGPNGDVSSALALEMKRKKMTGGAVSGQVAAVGGGKVESPMVVAEKNGKTYTWCLAPGGAYKLSLPAGKYTIYAIGKGFAPSAKAEVEIKDGAAVEKSFKDLAAPGKVTFKVKEEGSNQPIDARIVVEEGYAPVVSFLGKKTFFTDLEKIGGTTVEIAPGKYVFKVQSGENFIAKAQKVEAVVKSNEAATVQAALATEVNLKEKGWYTADLHHHSNLLDGATPPEYVVRSELAGRLDFLFISDHDTAQNHGELAKLAGLRKMPFIHGIEVSPSYAHFNIYPTQLGQNMSLDVGASTVRQLFDESRKLGAKVIAVNHGFNAYGYYYSLDSDNVPGGFQPDYDLVEINSAVPVKEQDKAVKKAYELWNQGYRYYLTAGTDTHDVWADQSGKIRVIAHLDGGPTVDGLITALRTGHTYVSYGPLIFPEVMFGEELRLEKGKSIDLKFGFQSVNGLKSVALVKGGQAVDTKTEFGADNKKANLTFTVAVDGDAWYSLAVEDANGNKAFTNPIWVKAVTYTKTAK